MFLFSYLLTKCHCCYLGVACITCSGFSSWEFAGGLLRCFHSLWFHETLAVRFFSINLRHTKAFYVVKGQLKLTPHHTTLHVQTL